MIIQLKGKVHIDAMKPVSGFVRVLLFVLASLFLGGNLISEYTGFGNSILELNELEDSEKDSEKSTEEWEVKAIINHVAKSAIHSKCWTEHQHNHQLLASEYFEKIPTPPPEFV